MKTSKIFCAVLFFIILLSLLSGCEKEVTADPIIFYSNENNSESYTMENQRFLFQMDGATSYFTLTDRQSGEVWSCVPEDAASDPLADATMKKWLQSTMIITYSIPSGLNTIFDNYSNSIAHGSFQILELEDGGIRVDYLIGQQERIFIVPEIITEARFDAILENLERSQQSAIKAIYRKLDPNNPPADETRESLLEKYPLTEQGTVYIQREGVADYRYEQAQELFAQQGYTYDDYLSDRIQTDSQQTLIQFNASVIYRLEEDGLTVQIPGDSLRCSDDYLMTSLQVLPYFGAGSTQDTGFLMIPDGGGAMLDFNVRNGTATSVSSKVYGWNTAKAREQMISENKVSFPVYAIQKNNGYLLTVVEQGAGEMTLEANTSGNRNSYNSLIPSFEIVHSDLVYVSTKSNVQVLVSEKTRQYEDLCLRYMPGSGDSYVDMAHTYRAYLMDTYPGLSVQEQAGLPVAVELIGAMDHITQVAGVPMQTVLPATTYDEASQILQQLQQLGITDLHLQYNAILNGGMKQTSLQKVKLIQELGSRNQLQQLAQQASQGGTSLYLGGYGSTVLDSAAFDGFNENADAIRDTLSDIVQAKAYHAVTWQTTGDPYYILNAAACADAMTNLSQTAQEQGFTGVAFSDIGSVVSSDFNRETPCSRDAMAAMQAQQLAAMQAKGQQVMIRGGNAYAVPYADFVVDMDLIGSSYDLVSRQIPFYQIALHGLVDYAGQSINMARNYETNLLKTIETGAGLYFLFAEIPPQELQVTDYTAYSSARYAQWADTLQDLYGQLNAQLGHTYSLMITDHRYLTDQVTVTVYEDGTQVFVNYGSAAYTLENGMTVQPTSYLVTGGNANG